MGKPPMPDTPPTPTVIESDRILARKWYRCGCGATYETIMESEPAARQRHHHHVADEVESVASQIAAAREAWGVSREAVAGLVTQASAVMSLLEKHGGGIVPHLLDTDDNPGEFLRAALERVREGGSARE